MSNVKIYETGGHFNCRVPSSVVLMSKGDDTELKRRLVNARIDITKPFERMYTMGMTREGRHGGSYVYSQLKTYALEPRVEPDYEGLSIWAV